MRLTDPITRQHTKVSVFVATLPYSGLVFAYGTLDEKMPAWLECHRRVFEFLGGVPLIVVPDNASTASNQISSSSRAREVNPAYAEFSSITRLLRSPPAPTDPAIRATSRLG